MHNSQVITRLAESSALQAISADKPEIQGDELSDDQLEHVVGGLARVWVDDVANDLMLRHYHKVPSSGEMVS